MLTYRNNELTAADHIRDLKNLRMTWRSQPLRPTTELRLQLESAFTARLRLATLSYHSVEARNGPR